MIVREFINLLGFKVDEKSLRSTEGKIKNAADSMLKFGTALTVGITTPFVALTTFISKTLSQFEQLDVAFETIIGDVSVAKSLMTDLLDLVAKTPFQVGDVTQNAKLLIGIGIEVKDIIALLTDLGNVSSGLSVPLERLALNFGQVKAQGKLTGRELRDFAVAGVPLLGELAKNLNIAEEEVANLISRGGVSYEMTREAFRTMANEGGRFADLMIKQSKTLGGLWSIFKDNLVLAAKSMSDQLLPVFKSVVTNLISFTQFIKDINPRIKAAMFWFMGLAAAIGPVTVGLALVIKAIIAIKLPILALGAALSFIIMKLTALFTLLLNDVMVFVKGGRSALGMFLLPWDILKKKISDFFAFTKVYFADFINGAKQVARGFRIVMDGIKFGYNDIVSGGFDEVSEGIGVMLENVIVLFVKLIDKIMPKIMEILVLYTPEFVKFGFSIGVAIGEGILKGLVGTVGKIPLSVGQNLPAGLKEIFALMKLGKSSGLDLQNMMSFLNPFGTKKVNVPGLSSGARTSNTQLNLKMDLTVPRDTPENQIKIINSAADVALDKLEKTLSRKLMFSYPIME